MLRMFVRYHQHCVLYLQLYLNHNYFFATDEDIIKNKPEQQKTIIIQKY